MKSRELPSLQTTSCVFALLGFLLAYLDIPLINQLAKTFSELFVNLLKLISLPLLFFSIIASLGGMKDTSQLKTLGIKTFKYTIFTTFIAAAVALLVYLWVDPATGSDLKAEGVPDFISMSEINGSYWDFLFKSIPNNILDPFLQNNVLGVLFLAVFISLALITLPQNNKKNLNQLFDNLFALILRMASYLMYLMPIAVACFIVLFFRDIKNGLDLKSFFLYLCCIVGANLIQAIIVLPTFLLYKRINPLQLFYHMTPALTLAFFSKSSSATLPMSIKCAEKAKFNPGLASFSFSLCSTINMNACAGFILITVLFNSSIYGVEFSAAEYISWIFIASIAAIGNAAVPMGCYFLASSFLASSNIPMQIMGIILPLYTLLDMLETAINVWSDSCIAAVIDKEACLLPEQDIATSEALPAQHTLDLSLQNR
ncbi:MAG: dicarboxylate/amino acid:cation symporter [Oligoflexales bacterium]